MVKVCSNYKIKLIYFSTKHIYLGKIGNYNEYDSVLSTNNYIWSKLRGECDVAIFKNSLIF